MKGRGWEIFDRYIKNWIQVDVFTSWDMQWVLKTVTRIKKLILSNKL